MTTQRTPYDELIAPLERNPGREQMKALRILSANREGYLRKAAEAAPLLEAARAALPYLQAVNAYEVRRTLLAAVLKAQKAP